MHGFETLGTAFQSGGCSIFGYVGGRIVFDRASAEAGAPLEGWLVISSRVRQAPGE